MSVLEQLVAEELSRVPAGPSAYELRRRVRVRRARRVGGSLTAVALVVAIGAGGAWLRSSVSPHVEVTEPAPPTSTTALPLATTAQFPPLAKIVGSVTGMVESNASPKAVLVEPKSGEIVATTRGRASALVGYSGPDPSRPVFLVQVVGDFVCTTCFGHGTPLGRVLTVTFDSTSEVVSFGLGPTRHDLSELGTVYRLELPSVSLAPTLPVATTGAFPALAKMTTVVSNVVRSDSRPVAGSAPPTSGTIVATTRGRTLVWFGGSRENLDARIYVAQVIGNFVCDECSRPSNEVAPPHGQAIYLLFDGSGKGFGFSVGPKVHDLAELGTVYRLPLHA